MRGFNSLKQFFFLAIILCGPLAKVGASPYHQKNPVFNKVTEGRPLCFARVYSQKHLQLHPLQTVKLIQAQLQYIKEYDQRNLVVKMSLINHPHKEYTATFTCFGASHCGIDCDGGSIDLVKGKNGAIRIINHGINLESNCGDQNEEFMQELYLDDIPGGDDIFDLFPVLDPSACG